MTFDRYFHLQLLLLMVLMLADVHTVSAQTMRNDSVSRAALHQIGVDFRPNYVAPTNRFVKGENARLKPIRQMYSAHLQYAFRFKEDSSYGSLYPHAYQGVGIGYDAFENSQEMGNPVLLYVFQGSRIAQFSSRLSLDYEWNFGASFGWKKYDEMDNPNNKAVGSRVNAYINLGFLLNWQFAPRWNLTAGIDLSHYSNGNTSYPNAGINSVGGRIGLVHSFGTYTTATGTSGVKAIRQKICEPYWFCDLMVYGATRKKGFRKDGQACLVPGSFGILGLNLTPMRSFSKYFRAGVSLDVQYDESANIEDYLAETTLDNPEFYRPPFRKQFSTGLSIRGELAMTFFSINAGIGRNVICQGRDTEIFYQMLALKVLLSRHLFLHIGYQLSDLKNPNNLMLGFGYRFRK